MVQYLWYRQGTRSTVKVGRVGGEDVWATEAGRGRKGTSDGITPGYDRDLGAVRGC